MSIAIADEHRELAKTVSGFLTARGARAANRALLEADSEQLPEFWSELGGLGWLGLHLPEEHGGSGFGLSELVIVAEEMGRAVAPGPFIPTVTASAVLAAIGPADAQAKLLPGLAGGISVTVPANLDPARRAARLTLDGAAAQVVPGGRQVLTDLARVLLAAEATGVARECTTMAAEYAKVREQFGRPIAMFQAVKHHCANMLVATELATAAVWDAARAGAGGGEQLTYTAAMAATLALAAADLCANLNTQVHGGIGFTWEHDAHLYLRRATAIEAIVDTEAAALQVADCVRQGVRREKAIDLPAEAEPIREVVREFVARIRDLDSDARRKAMLEAGYVMPNWPKPWGRDAGAVEQLVIEQEFSAAGIKRPSYGITSWVILTLIQYATPEQVSRWVVPALNQEVIWCQLFSEPGAGSDAAGVRTRATRADGGWVINGQKVWTSGAHVSRYGLATVRTNPDAPKHNGITMMVIDMKADGVTVRPLKMVTGNSDFNEVFFDNVGVPDADVVGPVNDGWRVARATLGNESVSIGGGGGSGGMAMPSEAFIAPLDAHPGRLAGGAGRVGRHIARNQTMGVLNLRRAHRAVADGEPGPEGNITKLLLSEIGHEAAAIMAALAGPDLAFLEGPGALGGTLALAHRAMSIAGGTSEIKRNQIG